MSWYDAIAGAYEGWSGEVTGDIEFYTELARDTDGPIVELGIGTGRVAIPLAASIGRPVIGIDSSAGMLDQARQRAATTGCELDLRLGDMGSLELDEPAGLIYCPARALLHIPTWVERRVLFESVVRSLRPGGRFAWNVFAFDHRLAARLDDRQQDLPSPHVNRYSVSDNRVDIELASGEVTSLWWATKNEWLGLIDVGGLELDGLYGDFDRSPLDSESGEYVFVTRKP